MRKLLALLGMATCSTIAGPWLSTALAQDTPGLDFFELDNPSQEAIYQGSNCLFFGAGRGNFKFLLQPDDPSLGQSGRGGRHSRSELTQQVMRVVESNYVPGASRNRAGHDVQALGTIDSYIFGALQDAGVPPANPTTDAEFIRRVTLDLTGRIPTASRVTAFLNDTSANKRASLIEELLASSQYVDKWTMFFGDLLKNNSTNTQIRRFPQGRDAFYQYIKASIAADKPYDQMAREIISAQGDNSYDPAQGQINWLAGGVVTGGPVQDIWDQQAANISDAFLGIFHMNCLLCHNGRGHLTSLSLWGGATTRYQAWQFSSFLSHTYTSRTPTPAAVLGNPYYWGLSDDTRYKTDYPLNTTTGNRPARQPTGPEKTVAPLYFFNGSAPAAGTDYRAALGQYVTSDFQFARAAVNYVWEQLFSLGLVSPSDQFDPARLDPDNPPPAPWTLQPSNARLLNALAQDFIDKKYSIKSLVREIVNSQAYQLSARYDESSWNPAWETLYARKLVRRLWSEEIHDSIALSSNLVPSYNIADLGTVSWAMQFPETFAMPTGGSPVTPFLDAFLRGNRDDEPRRGDGSISQALGLMNDPFVMSRVQASGSSLLAQNINLPDGQMVTNLFLAVLSRYPTSAEMATALKNLQSGARATEAVNLVWQLYNKVDFMFNY